jgi:hypothetical protein
MRYGISSPGCATLQGVIVLVLVIEQALSQDQILDCSG